MKPKTVMFAYAPCGVLVHGNFNYNARIDVFKFPGKKSP